ncbi:MULTISPECIES: 2,3-bisphosphoglycerate-independent phosphoglycerate mutase [Ruminococcus]|uniref:2,3-bisphosphoglycerate-independent phosphoglycerate mutase n=1 Tax=Ruminococcus albus 8 TaxID=246199 RepID=E9SA32_RUMAL|nr:MULTISPECIES: 2,3-bisphosphoglycerate-independent phosphoglycerate mutase [Ruminococcus]EGC03888.1 2,3-bisphosphoglycerate-independent phosphoglycerate mutase [Ruminococcus albus 8]MBO5558952.1 2,3-bisphosphoglycerate-independent phosphoglycerate mutase [Ruminococcus sp.]MCC3350490.1 2,3-bisphosphoglycerate-independent phosphoglycerate mutase [Ruminococcus albus 8]
MSNKKVILVVMDGVGISVTGLGDAVTEANTPTLDRLRKVCPYTTLKAHGSAVGLPTDDDMGNSEVGHNALGCGQIYSQGAKLVNESIESGKMFDSATWKELLENAKANGGTLHFIGLLSDGNVHSNISHLKTMIAKAKEQGAAKVRVHVLLDGRDVPATSAPLYIEDLEKCMASLNDGTFDAKIASGGGRMKVTMDRYQADWDMVKLGWETHVKGEGRQFANALEAVETLRNETGAIDQDLPAFVIAENGEPVGKIVDGDSVILFNFRGDRAIELSMAFDAGDDFTYFDRGVKPDVKYAGMLEYDGDLHIPSKYLVNPPEIKETMSEILDKAGLKSYAVSETQKYGHVTYFWNGNRSEKFASEEWKEIPSDRVSFDQRPWMKSAEITDDLIEAIKSEKFDFIRCNYPNGDMVGHTGSMDATIIGVESVDLGLTRLLKVAEEYGYTVLITADHGNADEMLEKNKKGEITVRTAHSLNRVPFYIVSKDKYEIKDADSTKYGLANVAPTVLKILGIEAPASWEESMI